MDAEYKREMKRKAKRFAGQTLSSSRSCLGSSHEVAGLKEIVGGNIVGVGFHPEQGEGGMTIDYDKDGKEMRVVFGYTELGLWVAWLGERA